MKTYMFPVLLSGLLLVVVGQLAAMQCTIKGEIINRDSKALLIHKYSESARFLFEKPTRIEITSGKFSYTFSYSETEAFELIFEDEFKDGNWMPIKFFPIEGVIELTLYPQQNWQQNKINGGELNAEYADFNVKYQAKFGKVMDGLIAVQNQLDSLDELESLEYKEVLKKLRATKSGDQNAQVPIYQRMDEMNKTHTRYTEKAKRLFVDPYDSLKKVAHQWKYEYIRNNVSLVSYFLLFEDVEMEAKDNAFVAQLTMEVYPAFQRQFPSHSYTDRIGNQLAGLQIIVRGGKYIDFDAPTLEGNKVSLSSLIRNKVALIDFWGSWCGPCIAKSRLVVPIYNKYKDKGFEVVGIAREFQSTDALKMRLSKEKFSWTNLVELDDKQKIWNRYGINNGVGLMVLVDYDGTILAIDPKPEEIEKILQEKL